VKHLFVKISLDQFDYDFRAWIARCPSEGLRISIFLYKPTGAIDIVLHEGKRPPPGVFDQLAEMHLRDAQTVGAMQ
jgi:hypothetical protein